MKTKRLKILFAVRSFPPTKGGMENFCFGLYKGLLGKVDITLLSNTKNRIGLPFFFIKLFFHTLFKGKKYDVIYGNDILTCFFALPAKLFHKPIVTSTYGLDLQFKFLKKKNLFMEFLRNVYTVFFNISSKNIDYFLPISEATKKLGDKLHFKPQRVIVPGMEVEFYKVSINKKPGARKAIVKKYRISEKKKNIFSVGRLVKRKGNLWFILKVMPNVRKNYHYIVGGIGEQYEEIKKAVEDRKLQDCVTVIGRPNDKDRNDLYLGADYFVMPNIKVEGDWEGFGIVAAEASLFGTPVLAAEMEGVTSAVVDGKNGVMFKSGDAKDAVKKLNQMRKMNFSARKVHEFTKKNFNNDLMGKRYVEVFNEVLK